MSDSCTEPVHRTCCRLSFCNSHYRQHHTDVHGSSTDRQVVNSEELEAINVAFEAVSHSRLFALHSLLGQGTRGRALCEVASAIRRTICEAEADLRSLLEIKTRGIPVDPSARLPVCFLKVRMHADGPLVDEFLYELAKLGYVSPSIAVALRRRSGARIEADQVTRSIIQDLERCLAIQAMVSVPVSEIAQTHLLLSKALFKTGNLQVAADSVATAISLASDNTVLKADAYLLLGRIYHLRQNLPEAGKCLAQGVYFQKLSAQTPDTSRQALINAGLAYELHERFDRALRQYEKAKTMTLELYGVEDIRTAFVSSHIARMHLRMNKTKSAETLYMQILPVLETANERSYLKTVLQGLCRIYSIAKKKDHLLMYTERYLTLLQPEEHQEQARVLKELVQLCTYMKLPEKVGVYKAKLARQLESN